MATSAQTAVFEFSDREEYSLTLSPFNPANTLNFKANCKAFNNTISSAAFSDTFVSTAGAPVVSIASAQIVTTENTIFYERGVNS